MSAASATAAAAAAAVAAATGSTAAAIAASAATCLHSTLHEELFFKRSTIIYTQHRFSIPFAVGH